jgi:uncharacterized protein with HEPN domain
VSRKDALFLKDMSQACEKIVRFTCGVSREEFLADERTYDAVLRNLEIIGEAAKHISENTRNVFPAVEWRKIAAFRDIVAHEYFGIDEDILWDVVKHKVPLLLEQLRDVTNRSLF